jgi:hypothetical protein
MRPFCFFIPFQPGSFEEVLNILSENVNERKAMLAFAIEYSEEMCQLTNAAQTVSEPVVITMSLHVATVYRSLQDMVCVLWGMNVIVRPLSQAKFSELTPRLGTAMQAVKDAEVRSKLMETFRTSIGSVCTGFIHFFPFSVLSGH